MSYKYLIETKSYEPLLKKHNDLKKIYWSNYIPFIEKISGRKLKFVKLKKVKDKKEIHLIYRYAIASFQILGLEHTIGEEKMRLFIDCLFNNINESEQGYSTIIKSLEEIGLTDKEINKIEKKYFDSFKIKNYDFVLEK